MQQQLIIGTLLHGGTYKIEKILGQGSFGITYLAEHTNLGKKVAIKEFFMKELNSRGEDGSITGMSDSSLSQNYCQKFKKEAINLSRLDHPNIVRVTDSFSENGTFYYVMDFIEGQNLNDYIKSHYIDEAEAVSIIKSVADALIYMHEEKHMLHLDLKPGNVMRRNSDGHVFLIDFGLSKHYSTDGQPETSTTIGLGTAGYAPIEQGNQAKNGEFRPTIDVYALGATFYKLLTRGTPPPASDLVSDDSLLETQMSANNVSKELIGIVIKAMNPNVKKRFQSVQELEEVLCSLTSPSTSVDVEQNSVSGIGDNKSEDTVMESDETRNKENFSSPSENVEENYYDETDSDSSYNKRKLIVGAIVAFVLVAIVVLFSQWGSSTKQIDSVYPETDTDFVSKQQVRVHSDCQSVSKSKDEESPNTNASQEMTKEIKEDNAVALKNALYRGNYKKVQKLANEGYSAAYGPLAKYYLQNNEYSLAETYAKKAKAAGFSDGKKVIMALENLGYYD